MKIKLNKIYNESCLNMKELPAESVNCCVTSPPYFGLRDYGHDEQIGLEQTPEQFVQKLVEVFREVKRVLKKDGTLWLNLGDSYSGGGRGYDTPKQKTNKGTLNMPKSIVPEGLKPKDLIGIPWRVAFALQADGWYLRQDIIWYKPNPMPESVTDRCTKSHEYIFLLSKSPKYYYDHGAIKTQSKTNERRPSGVVRNREYEYNSKENNNPKAYRKPPKSGNKKRKSGKERGCPENTGSNVCGSVPWEGEKSNKRSVWEVPTKPYKQAHFATFPEKLIVDCIKAGCPKDGIVLDPFMGAGTTAVVSKKLERNYIGYELNKEYIDIANKRIYNEIGLFK